MMLNVNVECGSENKSYTALNDVAVTKADDCKIADFEVSKTAYLFLHFVQTALYFLQPQAQQPIQCQQADL